MSNLSPTAPTSSSLRPHFVDFSRTRQAWEAAGCAVVAGAISGWALGASLVLYLATAGIASVAGLPAATQHRTLRGALARTTIGGFLWAAAVLTVFLLRGQDAVTRVPDPIGWYLVLATVPATFAGWAVFTWTNRVRNRQTPVGSRRSRTAGSLLPGGPLPVPVGAAPRG